MSNTAYEITERLLNALDKNYNVIDMGAISEIISDLENIEITKELLETTRLGKHVNELRRRTTDATLARRAKMLVKRWRDLVIPDRSGVKTQNTSSSQPHQFQQQTPSGSVDNTPHQSPLGSRGFSPAVTPRLSSPQVFPQTLNYAQKQGSLTPSATGVKASVLAQHIQQQQRRQPLTSPGHRNVPQLSKNTSVPFSPGLRTVASPLVSPVVSNHCRNTSPALKNLSPGLQQRFSPGNNRNLSPGTNRNSVHHNVSSIKKHSPSGVISGNISPGIHNSSKTLSPGVPGHRTISPGVKNTLTSQPTNKVNSAVKNLSPALRLPPESAVKTSSKHYDSDSQDVIWVDDDDDVYKPVPGNPLTGNDRSNDGSKHSSASNKRPRSPVNGEQWRYEKEEYSHKESKKAKKEPRGRKPKKRRNHKSENRTVDHSLDPVPSPFLPAISSSSTSPVLKNGVTNTNVPIPSPASSVPVLVDDVDSRSPKPEPPVVKQRSSRKNGCKKNLGMDDYSTFIKNKIPTAGKKVKTTKELLEEIQSRKLTSPYVDVEDKSSKPKEDFLTLYDNKKKEMSVITDVIELNDSNSSLKQEDVSQSKKVEAKEETKEKEADNEPVKFEPVETILARLPPVDRSWMYADEDVLTPVCTCTLIYSTPEVEVKMPSPLHQPKKSIFEMDYEKPKEETEEVSSVVVAALPLYEEKLDPHCEAALIHHVNPSNVTDPQVLALHNCFIPDVNGSTCDKNLQFGSKKKPVCKMDYWGSKPYYDCESKLFYSVVPKYNYLDYSLDRCVKNLTKVHFDKYEPVEATSSTKQWLDEIETNTVREIANTQIKTENYNSPADSPFSEADHGEGHSRSHSPKIESSDTVIQDSVNLDRDLAISNSVAFDDYSQSSAPTNNNDPSFNDKIVRKEYQMDCDDIDSVGSESCKPWTASTTVDQIKLESSAQDQTNDNYSNIDVFKCHSNKANIKRQLSYSDSVTLLPLNLKALNAAVGYTQPSEVDGDLSCVFRTNYDVDDGDALTYSVAADPVLLGDFNDLKREGVVERLRRNGSIDQTMAIDPDEDAVSDVDIQPRITDNRVVNNVDNYGALNPDLDLCVSNGCPEWLDKLSREEGFREWHEPVVRTSYNEEPLTVLPYIVID